MKCTVLYLITISLISATVPKDICDSCVPTDQCPLFGNLSKRDQQLWMERFPCSTPHRNQYSVPPGFAVTAKGDYVCCSNNIWGVENSGSLQPSISDDSEGTPIKTNIWGVKNSGSLQPSISDDSEGTPIKTNRPNNGYDFKSNDLANEDLNNNNHFYINNDTKWYPTREENYNNKNYWSNSNDQGLPGVNANKNTVTSNSNINRWPNNRNKYWNERPSQADFGNQYFNNGMNNNNRQDKQHENENNYGTNRRPPYKNNYNYKTTQRPSYQNNWARPPNNFNNQGQGKNPNNFDIKPYPLPFPNPPGSHNGNKDRNAHSFAPANHPWVHPFYNGRNEMESFRSIRQKRALAVEAEESNTTVRVENRISGGKATELYQYPWTVLLLTTFDYGNRQSGFNCGGSLISARYVLSAGHCVYDKGAVVKSVEVYLAEYDKRTFPRDCKVSQSGRKCIENIVMYAEDIKVHHQYENENLLNDISLIRLQGTAPYTEYIRPICLPSINIDEPEFSNLQFEVAGWGRNGQYRSDVKQATVLHLINRNECKRFYPMLTTKHLCAAGFKGEDTCKGDSGGPLMTLYRGRYFVAGVVSGKRADSPCGTAVPSLYTNVYHYLDWIRSNIKN